MRPNVWVDFGKFWGEDLAVKIHKYFDNGAILQYPQPLDKKYSKELLVPHFLRIKVWEVLFNCYNAWRYISISDKKMVIKLLCKKLREPLLGRLDRMRIIWLGIKKLIKDFPTIIIQLLIPKKKYRHKIKNKLRSLLQIA